MMNKSLELYKNFIDSLVRIRNCVLVRWVKEKGWPKLPENDRINTFLSELTADQKEVLAEMIQEARDGGIHDVLVLLNDEINLTGLRLSKDGVDFAIEPYETEMYYDWVCRREGDEWPESELDDKYKD
jgi:hypothetical protein